METKFSKEELTEFRGLFEALDSKHDGVITSDELGDAMRALGQKPTEAELEKMIDKADLDGDGKIDFYEFSVMMSRQNKNISKEDELKDVFRMMDRDGNGQISADELHQVMVNLREAVTREDVLDMIRELDMDGNGEIDMEEFVKIMLTN